MLFPLKGDLSLNDAFLMLGLSEDSSVSDLKTSYRKAARLYHPDARSEYASIENFLTLTTAYKTLLNSSILPDIYKTRETERELKDPALFTVKELTEKFDQSSDSVTKLLYAEQIFLKNRDYFIEFSIKRLPEVNKVVGLNMISLLGKIRSRESINAIGRFLFSPDKSISIKSYFLLESSDKKGKEILDKKIRSPKALFYRLRGILLNLIHLKKSKKVQLPSTKENKRLKAISQILSVELVEIVDSFEKFRSSELGLKNSR